MRLVKSVKPEKKWYEIGANGVAYNSSGNIVSMNQGITQGSTDFGTRIGDKIFMTSLNDRLMISSSAASSPVVYRIIYVSMKNNPDATISMASQINLILHSTPIAAGRGNLAPYDKDNRSSYVVHYDKVFTLNPQTGNAGTYLSVNRHHKINLKLKQICTYAAGGTYPTKNELFRIIISDTAGAYVYNTVLNYTDS